MKKIILIIVFMLYGSAFAIDQSQIAQVVAKNPELLNTPQAKEYISKHGGTANSVDTPSVQNKLPEVENTIIMDDTEQKTTQESNNNNWGDSQKLTDDEAITQKIKDENTLDDGSLRLSPLQYKSDDEQIKRIKSIQVHRKARIGKLERFSKEFFRNKNEILQNSIPTPKDYTLSRGDIINFWIYGKEDKNFELTVNAEGNIDIPEVGPVRVAGERFEEVKTLLSNYLSSSYKNSKVVVNLNSYANAQITVSGFVEAPGIYNTTSVSSVKDLLVQAHGVSDVGSVRNIEIKRDGVTIKHIDFYHLISEGLDDGDFVLKPNDIIFIPRAYGLVSIEGAVYKEAIYEIEAGESLWHILSFAGGIRANADGYSIRVKRYKRNSKIENLTLSASQARNFRVHDGDEIYVDGLNTTQDNYILITGNVVREGKRAIRGEHMSLRKLLKKELIHGKLNSLFLENTRFDYAMIKRVGDDLKPKIYNVNLKDILDSRSDFRLHNRDELYIFNNLDTGTAPYVTINGTSLIKEGKYIFHKGMSITDLINQAGIKTPYDKQKVKIVSAQNESGQSIVTMINMNTQSEYKLHEKDAVTLFDLNETHPIQTATISGEIVKPGSYVVSAGMTLSDFISSAGGLKDKAYGVDCEIIRYTKENGERRKEILNIALNEANTFLVKQYDEVNIKKSPNWDDRKTIQLLGEVKFPGTYVVHSGEKLSSVIQRAGGFTNRAFLYGAIFTRESIKELQRKSLQKELSRLKEQVILVSIRNSSTNKAPADITGLVSAVDSLIAESKKFQPIGRITIALNEDLDSFEYSQSNLTLEDGDILKIPSYNDTIVVNGEVMLPTALTYEDDNIETYIDRSGGLTHLADDEHIYVIHANGEAQKANLGSWLFSSNNATIKKGDVITVPKKFYYDTRNMDLTKDIADIFYKLSLTVAAAHTVGAI